MAKEDIHVLMIDDEIAIADQAEEFLEKESELLHVDPVYSGEEALEEMKEKDYSAIIADYKMPGLDGIELLKEVREEDKEIAFIVFTGKGREEVAMRALNFGADRYFRKGDDPKEQYKRLAEAVMEETGVEKVESKGIEEGEWTKFSPGSFKKKFGDLDKGSVLLLMSPAEENKEINEQIVKELTNREDVICVYITILKPAYVLQESFKEVGADTDKLFYIDCASELTESAIKETENTLFQGPSDLTGISIALNEIIEDLSKDKEKVLIFNTISSLLIYNSERAVSSFTHTIISKMREEGVKSIIIAAEEETGKGLRPRLIQYSDEMMKIE